MYAIIETGGKQYRVKNGDRISVEKLNVADGEKVVFDKVLVAGEGNDVKVGTPYIDGCVVEGNVIETGKGKKVIIFKYKAKKDYRKKQGHRQPYTLVEITSIDGNTEVEKVAAPAEEQADAPAAAEANETVEAAVETEVAPVQEEAEAVEAAEEEKSVKKPSLKSMRKAELIEFAKENNIEIDEKATNAVMIETIEAALK